MDEKPDHELDEFDRILKRMLETKPLSKEEISAKIKAERTAKRTGAYQKYQKYLASRAKKLGQ